MLIAAPSSQYNICVVMNRVARLWAVTFAMATLVCAAWILWQQVAVAGNIFEYKDTLSTSAPGVGSNHTLAFRLEADVSPGGYIDITPPIGFEVLGTSTFEARNVEMIVNGTPRVAASVASPGYDQVDITPGSPGLIRYTLEPTAGLSAGSQVVIKIGNHTSNSLEFSETYSTSTGTTTTEADISGIINASTTGTHKVDVRVYDGGEVAGASFSIAIVEQVGVGPVDTRETDPPYRFNGSPTSTVGGTTLSVEIALETDELSVCRYSASSSVPYTSMTNTFSNTGFINHSTVVPVTPNSVQRFYVRCVDDEGNINIDDYVIEFAVSDIPTGTANEEGDVSGDGSGSGNQGTGSGGGGGGTSGSSNGQEPEEGGTAGTGGSGGGGGGGRGSDDSDSAGGGFESEDAPYRSGDGRVVITGFAFPRARINVLVDGNQSGQVTAGSNGSYSITLDEIARGVYTFGVFGTDSNQVKSTTFSTSFTVTGARTTALSNINVPPTLRVQPDPATPGQPVTISGFTLPNATVTIENERDGSSASRKSFTATSDASGAWSVSVDTQGFQTGTYKARARAVQTSGQATNFSGYTVYGVGQNAIKPSTADLNSDGKVNLTDFSILLFWWNTDGGSSNPPADINDDGRVTLTDFSILLFNWTG